MEDKPHTAPIAGAAALEHLTGPSHGKVMWLNATTVDISMTPRRYIYVSETLPGEPSEDLIARLHSAGDTYEIEVPEGRSVWVNGVRVQSRRLEKGDMIEFGEAGPLSRFCLYGEDTPIRQTIIDILNDSIAYLRVSRQPKLRRVYRAVRELLRRLSRETTALFRTTVTIAIIALAALTYQQSRLNSLLQQRIESSAARLDSFAAAIARAGKQALRPSDLEMLRQELVRRLTSGAERLAVLEKRSQASKRVIAGSIPSVIFIQGAYGFRENSSKRMLRHVVDDGGRPLISPLGQPLLSLEGSGPVAERQFTGTGFAVGDKGTLISNRHLALPWENDASAESLAGQGLVPVMIKLIVYQPGKAAAIAVELLSVSEDADLAILKFRHEAAPIPGLRLADAVPAAGDEVIVMGYPTGLRSMLAQSGAAFIEELQKIKDTGFWSVAARLAKKGYIAPLASRGIVGQATAATIVYDAETTHGGSGGPVLNANGSVVAVNTAILPEFGGSNLGVPAAKVREFLEQAGIR
jgi:S1-C subfamily serine protease